MKGYIYIASAFTTLVRSKCNRDKKDIDGDPHFWTQPPTWGICRPDLRKCAEPGDYVFFVLPRKCICPQMIFGYMLLKEKITHLGAYRKPGLKSKRMGIKKNPNGNIIVNSRGDYNRFDRGVHRKGFNKIKRYYFIGDRSNSRMLEEHTIRALAPNFLPTLSSILGFSGTRAIDIISRRGRELDEDQVNRLLSWLASTQ